MYNLLKFHNSSHALFLNSQNNHVLILWITKVQMMFKKRTLELLSMCLRMLLQNMHTVIKDDIFQSNVILHYIGNIQANVRSIMNYLQMYH